MVNSGDINRSIRDQEQRLGQDQALADTLTSIKGILTSTLKVEESAWRNLGYTFDSGDQENIQQRIKADPRREDVIKQTMQTQDLAWFQTEISKVIKDAFRGWSSTQQTGGFVNPRELDPNELLEDLRQGVVRLVFVKKGKPLRDENNNIVKDPDGEVVLDGGQRRVMWATRNSDIVTLYYQDGRLKGTKGRLKDDDNDAVTNELAKDYFTVLDLEKEEFRTFKPSTLLEFDSDNNVGAWMHFDVDNDAWYNCVYENTPPSTYYVPGDTKALYAPQNPARTVKEERYKEEAVQSGALKTQNVVNWERENQQNFIRGEGQYIKILNGTYQDTSIETAFETICDFARNVHQDIDPLIEDSEVPNMFVSKRLSKRRRGNSVINSSVEIQVGDAVIIVGPYYIVNTKTGRVYLDRYDIFSRPASTALLSQEEKDIHTFSDTLIAPFIERLIENSNLKHLPKPKKRERILSQKDLRRLQRLNNLHEIKTQPLAKQYLDELGITLGYTEGRNMYKITVKGTGVVFVVNSRTIGWLNPTTQQPEELVTVVRHTSALTEMREAIRRTARHYQANPKIVKALKTLEEFLVDKVFNLRVTSHNGIAF